MNIKVTWFSVPQPALGSTLKTGPSFLRPLCNWN